MTQTVPGSGAPAAPRVPPLPAAAFVLVWSTGYIAAPLGVDAMAPITLLTWRFAVAALMLVPLAWVLRGRPRLTRQALLRLSGLGLVLNALQFGLIYVAFEQGLGATLGALLHSLSPVLTAVLAGLVLRERLTRRQVLGFVAGVAGVLVVLGPDLSGGGGAVALLLGVGSLLSLSLGTLGQRWTGGVGVDPVWAATVQCAAAVPPLAVLALLTEGIAGTVSDPWTALWAVLWIAGVNSVVGLLLLGTLVRRGGAGASASVFFLMPPVTAVMAFVVLGDTFGVRELVGLVLSVAGVAVATGALRRRRPASGPTSGPTSG